MGLTGLKPDQFHKPKEGGRKAKHISVVIYKSFQSFRDSELRAANGGTL